MGVASYFIQHGKGLMQPAIEMQLIVSECILSFASVRMLFKAYITMIPCRVKMLSSACATAMV